MKRFFTIMMGYFLVAQVWAQGYIGPSPDAMGMIRHANVGASHYTGSANINIPLGGISGRELGVDLSLHYNGFGHRVQDVASSEGLGWNLSAGGMITRVVRGTPDDKAGGFCENNGTDAEPDLFSFSFLGRTGKFVINKNKQAVIFPFQDLKVIPGMCGVGNTWEIIDENGTRYHFGTTMGSRERISTKKGHGPFEDEHISTWYLTRIISANGTDEVTLSYGNSHQFTYTNYYYEKDEGQCPSVEKSESVAVRVKGSKLTEISTSGGKVKVFWNHNRKDIVGGRSLASISVEDNSGEPAARYYFEYGYFQGCLEPDNMCKRLKLERIYDLSTTPLYEFQYNETINLPARNSKNIDYLGLYNNNTVDSWIPAITEPISYPGASREPDAERMKANLLTQIHQRGGGQTQFLYEPHEGFHGDTFIPTVSGNRIKSIITSNDGEPVQTVNYRYGEEGEPSVSSGVLFRMQLFRSYRIIPGFPIYLKRFSHTYLEMFDINGTHVGYSRVEEETVGKGYVVYTFTNHDDFPDQNINGDPIDEEDPDVSTTTRFWERGNPLTVTIRKANYSDIIQRETYEYNHDLPEKNSVTSTRVLPFVFTCFSYGIETEYKISSTPFTLTKKTTEVYDQTAPSLKLTNTEEYAYDTQTFQIVEIKAYNSALSDEKHIKRYKFVTHPDYDLAGSQMQSCQNDYSQCLQPCDVNDNACWQNCYNNYVACLNVASTDERVVSIQALRGKHAQNTLVEEQSWLEKGGMKFLGANLTLYKSIGPGETVVVPESTWACGKVSSQYTGTHISSTDFVVPGSFVQAAEHEEYDPSTARLLKTRGRNGESMELDWGNDGVWLVGETVNPGNTQFTANYVNHPIFGVTEETDTNGKKIKTEYDAFGRVRLVRDDSDNILSRKRYHFKHERAGMRIKPDKVDAYVNQEFQFKIEDIVSPSGGTPEFAWDMANGTVYDDSRLEASASYGTAGHYEVKAVMFTDEFDPFTAIREVFAWTPMNFSLCIDGPQSLDLCYIDPVGYGNCTQQNNQPTSPVTIKVNFSSMGCPSMDTFTWEYKGPSDNDWNHMVYDVGSTFELHHDSIEGIHEVRCTYTDGCGDPVTRSIYMNIYKSNPLCF